MNKLKIILPDLCLLSVWIGVLILYLMTGFTVPTLVVVLVAIILSIINSVMELKELTARENNLKPVDEFSKPSCTLYSFCASYQNPECISGHCNRHCAYACFCGASGDKKEKTEKEWADLIE